MDKGHKKIPNHVAIIMDGNGRWAKKRLMPRSMGHKAGVETIKRITMHANTLGIKVLSLYAFSTENWGRPDKEVNYLMSLPKVFFKSFMPELIKNNVKIETIGDINRLPRATLDILLEAKDQTANNQGLILNFAINYGGQEELIRAFRKLGQKIVDQDIDPQIIDKSMIERELMTHHLGEFSSPDLMIRTSGEIRISNFLLWQLAYSEFYFTEVLWPDFKEEDFDKAIQSYQNRQRRFGKIIES